MPSFCDQCGNEIKNENAKFCDKCGAEIKNHNDNSSKNNVIICPHCAKPNPVGQTTCSNCGLDVQMENNLVAVIIGYITLWIMPIISLIIGIYLLTRKNNKSKTQGVFLIVFIIIYLIIGFIIGYYWATDSGYLIYAYGSDWYLYELILRYVTVPVIGTIIGAVTWYKNFTIFK